MTGFRVKPESCRRGRRKGEGAEPSLLVPTPAKGPYRTEPGRRPQAGAWLSGSASVLWESETPGLAVFGTKQSDAHASIKLCW